MLGLEIDAEARAVRASRGRVFFAALAIATLVVLPVLTSRHLPLLDAPYHEARLSVLRDVLITGRGSAFYDFETFFLPNIAFDVIGLGLVTLVDPETVGRIFFGATLVLTLWGVLVLNRVIIGRWSVVPLVSALLLYNWVSIEGFLSYTFGLAMVPWALAVRLALHRAPSAVRFLLGAAFGIVLLFCHASAFSIYATMSMGFALDALIRRRLCVMQVAVWVLEMVPAAVLFLSMSLVGQGGIHYLAPYLSSKLFIIVKSVFSASEIGDVAFLIGALLFLILLAICSRTRLARPMVPGLAGLVFLYFALPDELASGGYVDARMPIAIALLVFAGLDVQTRRSRLSSILICLIVTTIVIKQAALSVLWRSFDPWIDSFVGSLERLPAGSIIMQAECEPAGSYVLTAYRNHQPPESHLPAMASFDDAHFVPSTQVIFGQHPIRVKPAYQPYYDLFRSWPDRQICSESDYDAALRSIMGLANSEAAAGRIIPPLYFLLIRPRKPQALLSKIELIEHGRGYELYAIKTR